MSVFRQAVRHFLQTPTAYSRGAVNRIYGEQQAASHLPGPLQVIARDEKLLTNAFTTAASASLLSSTSTSRSLRLSKENLLVNLQGD